MALLNSLIVPNAGQLLDTYINIALDRRTNTDLHIDIKATLCSSQPGPPSGRHPLRAAPEMETSIDSEATIPPNKPASTSADNTTSITRPDLNLQSIEDFDLEHPYNPTPQAFKSFSDSVTCENTVNFQHACDRHGIRPVFNYSGEQVSGFMAKLEFNGHTIRTASGSSTKKRAKEAVSKLALEEFSFLLDAPAVKGAKQVKEVASEVDMSEDWVGALHMHLQGNKSGFATFREFATNTVPLRFSCTLTIPGSPNPFGNDQITYPSKKLAKIAATKEAVCWLRAQDPTLAPPVKKPPHNPADPSPKSSAGQDVLIDEDFDSLPATARMHRLVAALGFNQPRFDCQLSEVTNGESHIAMPVYDAAVVFSTQDVEIEPRLAGPQGRVEKIAGQKKAKAACYEQVILLLKELVEARRTRA